MNSDDNEIEKLIRQSQDIAREEAKKHKSYIVYKNKNNEIVKEWYDGTIEIYNPGHE